MRTIDDLFPALTLSQVQFERFTKTVAFGLTVP